MLSENYKIFEVDLVKGLQIKLYDVFTIFLVNT